MQFRKITALIVFSGSYLPLSLILLAQNTDYSQVANGLCWPLAAPHCSLPLRNPIWALGMLGLTLFCFLITVLALAVLKPRKQIEVVEAKYIPTDLMNYTLPYIVSFMSIDYQDTGKFIGFAVFLGWMFWISYKSGQIIMNPVLIALGWRLYETGYKFAGGTAKHSGRALVKGHLSQGSHLQSQLQDILIIKPGT